MDRKTAAETCGMDRQTLRDWVHRYNAYGLAGLSNRRSAGPKPRLSAEQKAELARMARGGPDPAVDGVVRWRRVDLQRKIEVRLSRHHARAHRGQAVGRARISPAVGASAAPEIRSRDPGGVQKNFAGTVTDALPESARGKPLEIWFQDEARVGQQGTLTRIWAPCGSRPRAPRDTRYTWAYIFGAVCPERGATAALVMPNVDTAAMNAHLAEFSRTVAEGAHAILVLDGAGWHGSKALRIPDNITLLPLPPYAPELNPVENVWAYLRANRLAISVFETYEDIVARSCDAWNFFANDIATVRSITTREYAKAVKG
ncbi:IS630 family transposase [Roseovarius tibetensis]|uniref:IS630 family transposase n=1 Tax=Roseovarius tibetensis TaxID=2685897 RepID=UPI003D7F9924